MQQFDLRQYLRFTPATFQFLAQVITEIQGRLPMLKEFELLDKVLSNVIVEQYKNKPGTA